MDLADTAHFCEGAADSCDAAAEFCVPLAVWAVVDAWPLAGGAGCAETARAGKRMAVPAMKAAELVFIGDPSWLLLCVNSERSLRPTS